MVAWTISWDGKATCGGTLATLDGVHCRIGAGAIGLTKLLNLCQHSVLSEFLFAAIGAKDAKQM